MKEQQWQPIETAPKDGTLIWLREGAWSPFHARWISYGWSVVEYQYSHRPTHWMPLTSPFVQDKP